MSTSTTAGAPAIAGRIEEVVPFTARDGFACNLVHVRPQRDPVRGPVLLVHGAGVRANIFRAPVPNTLVDQLVERGYDVWLENWRASIDLAPNQWTLDRVARHDHPAAVEEVVRRTGADSIQAVIHCQGSTSFMLSAIAGLVPQVRTVVANAVTLHPVLPRLSRAKLWLLTNTVSGAYPYLNPQWGFDQPTLREQLIAWWVRLTHHECRNEVCRMASFVYGIGFPTLWEHENLDVPTHEWLKQEFGAVPRSFFIQMNESVQRGYLVPAEPDETLPEDVALREPQTDARFAFIAGALNRCFLPESQRRTFEMFDRARPGYHSLHVVPRYAHLDVFMGRRAARDVTPLILDELEK